LWEEGVAGPNRNWYRLLWGHLRDHGSVEGLIEQRPVSFITFNYDRSLEHYLFTVFRSHFGTASEVSVRFLAESIFHVHGVLGSYRGIGEGPHRRYIPDCDITAIEKAMQGLHIVHEVEKFAKHSDIRERIESADQVIFLGFQYHRENVNKLFTGVTRRPKKVCGSCYGMSDTECRAARKRIALILDMAETEVSIGGARPMGCYDFLKERVHFE
jgi:hypothetical protein